MTHPPPRLILASIHKDSALLSPEAAEIFVLFCITSSLSLLPRPPLSAFSICQIAFSDHLSFWFYFVDTFTRFPDVSPLTALINPLISFPQFNKSLPIKSTKRGRCEIFLFWRKSLCRAGHKADCLNPGKNWTNYSNLWTNPHFESKIRRRSLGFQTEYPAWKLPPEPIDRLSDHSATASSRRWFRKFEKWQFPLRRLNDR